MDGLGLRYVRLPQALDATVDLEENAPLSVFLDHVAFVNDVCRTADDAVAAAVAHEVRVRFCADVVRPHLCDPAEQVMHAATVYVTAVLERMDAPPLVDAVVAFLLGDNMEPETRGGAVTSGSGEGDLRTTLIRRMDSISEEVAVATTKLFEALLGLYSAPALYNLVLRNLVPVGTRLAEAAAGAGGDGATPRVNSAVEDFLTLTINPGGDGAAQVRSGYETYLHDAHDRTSACSRACESWPALVPTASDGDGAGTDATEHEFYEGLFLEVVFNKLERFLEHGLNANLVLTGVVSRLLDFPHPLLSLYLLSADDRLGARTLYRILREVGVFIFLVLVVFAGEGVAILHF